MPESVHRRHHGHPPGCGLGEGVGEGTGQHGGSDLPAGGKGFHVVTVRPDTMVAEALQLLKDHNLGAVVVCPDGMHILGIMTERDVVRHWPAGPTSATDRCRH